MRLECWVTLDGKTVCPDCATKFTASRPVALEAPRACSDCRKEITRSHPAYALKIISGGQTGADRGAIEAARELGHDYGGWVPKGRLAEGGKVPLEFGKLQEHPSSDYPPRTYANVRDADATVIFAKTPVSGGSRLTVRYCRDQEKPFMVIRAQRAVEDPRSALRDLTYWLGTVLPQERKLAVRTLNVAGSRESRFPGIQAAVRQIVRNLIRGHAAGGRS